MGSVVDVWNIQVKELPFLIRAIDFEQFVDNFAVRLKYFHLLYCVHYFFFLLGLFAIHFVEVVSDRLLKDHVAKELSNFVDYDVFLLLVGAVGWFLLTALQVFTYSRDVFADGTDNGSGKHIARVHE